ncbi:MAG: FlgD immunoglobulin-like domain containing protein [Candidatus Firestonebacteria bacterium]
MRFLILLILFSFPAFSEDLINYPNPFSSSQTTKLKYTLVQDAEVTIKIFSLFGDLVYEKTISASNTYAKAGDNEFPWDGKNGQGEAVKSGGYICKIIVKYSNETKILKRKISVIN